MLEAELEAYLKKLRTAKVRRAQALRGCCRWLVLDRPLPGFAERRAVMSRCVVRCVRVQAAKLEEELGAHKDRQCCVVCQDAAKTVLILPCRHLCCCKDCFDRIMATTQPSCPVCRGSISTSLDVFA